MFAIPFKPLRAASAMLLALALTSGAHASAMLPSDDAASRIVRYDDLNLAKDAGAERFAARTHRAIDDMYENQRSDILAVKVSVAQAKRIAMARADAQVAAIVSQARSGGAS